MAAVTFAPSMTKSLSIWRSSSTVDSLTSDDGPDRQASDGSKTGGIGNERDDYDDRKRRWEERKLEKKRLANERKQMGFVGRGESAKTSKQKLLKSRNVGDVEELLIQKGLPIDSLQLVGSGRFAKVYKGTWRARDNDDADSTVAVKVVDVEHSRPRVAKDGALVAPKVIEREAKISHVQQHPNLIRVIEASIDTLPYAIVVEYCPGGSLYDISKGGPRLTLGRFSWDQRLKAALDIANGMAFLHEQNIVHRDLKAQNVLLVHPIVSVTDVVHAKVCDFGLARYLPQEDHQTQLTRDVGSWYFMAPEIFDTDGDHYDQKVDVYSFAMLLYEMIAGSFCFKKDSMTMSEFVVFAVEGGRPSEDAIDATTPGVLRVLMKECWQASPSSRPSFVVLSERLVLHQPGLARADISRSSQHGGWLDAFLCCARGK
mmetsp:Transcript_28789/g.76891  ORF Transcript_28789/g.76891 Transcript_28789/m.76891 type:complete len:429 (+) Transcript_28789:95-1381(+)